MGTTDRGGSTGISGCGLDPRHQRTALARSHRLSDVCRHSLEFRTESIGHRHRESNRRREARKIRNLVSDIRGSQRERGSRLMRSGVGEVGRAVDGYRRIPCHRLGTVCSTGRRRYRSRGTDEDRDIQVIHGHRERTHPLVTGRVDGRVNHGRHTHTKGGGRIEVTDRLQFKITVIDHGRRIPKNRSAAGSRVSIEDHIRRQSHQSRWCVVNDIDRKGHCR